MCLYNLSNKKNRYGYSIVTETINKMKQGKAGGPSGVIVEMIKAGGRKTVTAISELVNLVIYEKNIPEDWKAPLL